MTRDFTFDIYEQLIEAGLESGYEHITMRKYLSTETLPERFIIYRHDVDRKPEKALTMAQLEANHGVRSTYYFRTIDKTLQPELIQEIENLGHEIGYHYEDMDRANGFVDGAHESFSDHLGHLREHVMINTICMHGNPLTAHDNRDMWDGDHGFNEYRLLGEAYLSMDFVDVTYFSDTGRTWKDGNLKVKDHPVGDSKKDVQVDTTDELIDLVNRAELSRMCILSHPNRWARTKFEYAKELAKDSMINLGKRSMSAFKSPY